MGSYAIGLVAGLVGDKVSLGFVEETERQVSAHLAGHLGKLPEQDSKKPRDCPADENRRRTASCKCPSSRCLYIACAVKWLMRAQANVMTTVAYWV